MSVKANEIRVVTLTELELEGLLERAAAAAVAKVNTPEVLTAELPRITRRLRHPGNHRYVWGIDRAVRRHVERLPGLPYPKVSFARRVA